MENTLYHTTSEDGLHKILQGGRVKSLKHVASENPDQQVTAETSFKPWNRERLPAAEALQKMQGVKEVDKVFLTRNRWLPNYGKFVIAKTLGDRYVSKRLSLNTIPDEYTTKRALSAFHNAKIYAPKDRLDELRKTYPKAVFRPLDDIMDHKTSLVDRVKSYPGKIKDYLLTKTAQDKLPEGTPVKILGKNAFLSGSSALGIATGFSDVDVLIPYKTSYHYRKAVDRLREKYPTLQEGAFSKDKVNKTVLTGRLSETGPEVDIVLGYGEKPQAFTAAFKKVQKSLTPEMKAKIIERKSSLKASWFFPETRYKRYKKSLARDLGLSQHYF